MKIGKFQGPFLGSAMTLVVTKMRTIVFQGWNSQAVRIPKEFWLNSRMADISRCENRLTTTERKNISWKKTFAVPCDEGFTFERPDNSSPQEQRRDAKFWKKTVILSVCLFYEVLAEEVQYLDSAASWEISNAALDEFMLVSKMNGNSSGINSHAKKLKQLENAAASVIAAKINAKAEQIHFTSGATASNNIAILGAAYKHPKCHLITSRIEHKSALNVFKHLESNGWKVTYLDVDKFGRIDIEQLSRSIRKDTKLISIQLFNSEIGTRQNVAEIGRIARKRGVLFHTDAAQSFCKYQIDVNAMNIDLLTISGYKVGAPKGIGALYVRDDTRLQPIMFGSGDKLFPGSKSTALICSFAAAVKNFSFDEQQIASNFNTLVGELSKIDDVYINSATPSHVVSVSIGGVLLKDILAQMSDYSFAAGCSCLGQEKSNVMEAIDPENHLPSCTIRVSFSDGKQEDILREFAKNLKQVVQQLRREKSIGKGCESDVSSGKQRSLANSLDEIKELLREK